MIRSVRKPTLFHKKCMLDQVGFLQRRRSVGRARGASRKVRALVSEGEPKNGGLGVHPREMFWCHAL